MMFLVHKKSSQLHLPEPYWIRSFLSHPPHLPPSPPLLPPSQSDAVDKLSGSHTTPHSGHTPSHHTSQGPPLPRGAGGLGEGHGQMKTEEARECVLAHPGMEPVLTHCALDHLILYLREERRNGVPLTHTHLEIPHPRCQGTAAHTSSRVLGSCGCICSQNSQGPSPVTKHTPSLLEWKKRKEKIEKEKEKRKRKKKIKRKRRKRKRKKKKNKKK